LRTVQCDDARRNQATRIRVRVTGPARAGAVRTGDHGYRVGSFPGDPSKATASRWTSLVSSWRRYLISSGTGSWLWVPTWHSCVAAL